jgi:hypothetical protein
MSGSIHEIHAHARIVEDPTGQLPALIVQVFTRGQWVSVDEIMLDGTDIFDVDEAAGRMAATFRQVVAAEPGKDQEHSGPAWIAAGEAAPGPYFHKDAVLHRAHQDREIGAGRLGAGMRTYWWKAIGPGAFEPVPIADDEMVYGPIPAQEGVPPW